MNKESKKMTLITRFIRWLYHALFINWPGGYRNRRHW
ncbi:hypothetical protein ES708_12621 [subsurface metagenome]